MKKDKGIIRYAKVFNELLPIALKINKEITINNFFKFCDITIYANCQSIFQDILDTANKLRNKKVKKMKMNDEYRDCLDCTRNQTDRPSPCDSCYQNKPTNRLRGPRPHTLHTFWFGRRRCRYGVNGFQESVQ